MKRKKIENYIVDDRTKEGDCCPECGADWDGGDIFEHFMNAKEDPNHEQHGYYGNKSDEEILETAGHYGWTVEDKRRFGKIIGIELSYDDPEHYDGVSYWQCPECYIAWNRFTGDRTERFVKTMEEHIKGKKKLEEYEQKKNK